MLLAVGLLAAALAAVPAQAKLTKKTYTLPVKVLNGTSPFDIDNCSAISLVEFPRIKHAVSASVEYTYAGQKASKPGTGPLFDDVYLYVKTYAAPTSKHWIVLGESASDGGGVLNDCSDVAGRTRSQLARTAKVTVLVDPSSSCGAAKDARTQWKKLIAAKKKELAADTNDFYKNQHGQQLQALTTQLRRLEQEVTSACAKPKAKTKKKVRRLPSPVGA